MLYHHTLLQLTLLAAEIFPDFNAFCFIPQARGKAKISGI